MGKNRSSSCVISPTARSPAGSPRRYESRGFWDKWYSQQKDCALEWTGQINDEVFKKIIAVIDEIPLRPGHDRLRVCELGCGCSNLAPMLRDHGVEVIGVDFSQEVINANRLRLPDIEWECWDALQLADKYEAGYFDCIIGKTLIDCFLARSDASGSIRKLLQQSHAVLSEQGAMVLLDKANGEAIIGRGRAEPVMVDADKSRSMTFRLLRAMPKGDGTSEEGLSAQRQWELEIPPGLNKHFVTRPAAAGSGLLVVWSTDEVATGAGIETGDLIVGFKKDGKSMQVGNPTETSRAIRASGKLTLLLERPACGTKERETAPLKTRLLSRRSTSQSDHLRRQQKARLLRAADTLNSFIKKGTSLPKLNLKPDSFISEHHCAAEGLFT